MLVVPNVMNEQQNHIRIIARLKKNQWRTVKTGTTLDLLGLRDQKELLNSVRTCDRIHAAYEKMEKPG